MSNLPPEFCPYCGAGLAPVDPPTAFRCGDCEEYVFHNPCPGGGVAVVDGDRLLLVEDFRGDDEWKLPEGRVECGESFREGVARELREETNLAADPADLRFFHDSAGEPVPEQYMVNVDFAVRRTETTGEVRAGSDATDARFWTAAAFEESEATWRASHRDRFESDSFAWLLGEARDALERAGD